MQRVVSRVALAVLLLQVFMVSFSSADPVAPVTVSQENIDRLLFTQNTDILRAHVNVMRAKDQVNIARGELMPSFSSVMAGTVGALPNFMISSASCLVPFIFPSNWFNLRQAKRQRLAEKTALEILKLNTYAVVLNLLVRLQGDEETFAGLTAQKQELENYLNIVRAQFAMGLVSESDLLRAEMDFSKTQVDLNRVQQLVYQEKAELRHALGYDMNVPINVTSVAVTPSRFEAEDAFHLRQLVHLRALERIQLDQLREAARAALNSARFSFLGGCSGSQGAIVAAGLAGNTGAFSVATTATVSFGFGTIFKIRLAKRNIQEIDVRHHELWLELGETIDTTLNAVRIGAEWERQAALNVDRSVQLLEQQKMRFQMGIGSVRETLESLQRLLSSRMDLVQARTNVAGHRLTLKRATLEGKFLRMLIEMRVD